MRRSLLGLLLLLPACSSAFGADADPRVWRTSAAQPMDVLRPAPAVDETCRQVLRLSAGGDALRLRLSNVLSPTPLTVAAATAGLRSTGAAPVPGSLRTVTVGGSPSFVVPPGEQVTSDAVELPTGAGDDLLVSFAVRGTASLSAHRIGGLTGWCSGAGTGDHTRDMGAQAFPPVGERAGLVVEDAAVAAPAGSPGSVVAVGDSLTDAPLLPDVHPRWPEVLATRLPGVPVVNAAIAGNRVLLEGGYGPPLVERFERDVLSRSGVGTVVLLAGTNDLARDLGAQALTAELAGLVRAAQADGHRVALATVPPASERTPAQQATRHAVNDWIRTSSPADLVVDADAVLRSPLDTETLRPAFDDGDGLHLSAAGQRALGEAVARLLR